MSGQAITTDQKSLPRDITAYDLLKSFAVIIMIMDHVGTYFFPDDQWWRAIGRIGFPVWFFLVGHASGRNLPLKLVGGAAILIAVSLLTGMYVFPMNALVTIILLRVFIDRVMDYTLISKVHIWGVSFVLLVLIFPSYFVTEYGTQALITAMFGYMIRHREKIDNDKIVMGFMLFTLMSFVFMQQVSFGFSQLQFLFVALGTTAVCMALYYFTPGSYPSLTRAVPKFVTWLLQFGGRRTLEIYVVHLVLFKFAALALGMEHFGWFDWTWIIQRETE